VSASSALLSRTRGATPTEPSSPDLVFGWHVARHRYDSGQSRRPESTVADERWTFEVMPQMNLQSLRATIRRIDRTNDFLSRLAPLKAQRITYGSVGHRDLVGRLLGPTEMTPGHKYPLCLPGTRRDIAVASEVRRLGRREEREAQEKSAASDSRTVVFHIE
jgi:hypothetical protein